MPDFIIAPAPKPTPRIDRQAAALRVDAVAALAEKLMHHTTENPALRSLGLPVAAECYDAGNVLRQALEAGASDETVAVAVARVLAATVSAAKILNRTDWADIEHLAINGTPS